VGVLSGVKCTLRPARAPPGAPALSSEGDTESASPTCWPYLLGSLAASVGRPPLFAGAGLEAAVLGLHAINHVLQTTIGIQNL